MALYVCCEYHNAQPFFFFFFSLCHLLLYICSRLLLVFHVAFFFLLLFLSFLAHFSFFFFNVRHTCLFARNKGLFLFSLRYSKGEGKKKKLSLIRLVDSEGHKETVHKLCSFRHVARFLSVVCALSQPCSRTKKKKKVK